MFDHSHALTGLQRWTTGVVQDENTWRLTPNESLDELNEALVIEGAIDDHPAPPALAGHGRNHRWLLARTAGTWHRGTSRRPLGGTMNSRLPIRFFERLIKAADRKVFLIVDNLRVHYNEPVKGRAVNHCGKIELFCLPPYSPETVL